MSRVLRGCLPGREPPRLMQPSRAVQRTSLVLLVTARLLCCGRDAQSGRSFRRGRPVPMPRCRRPNPKRVARHRPPVRRPFRREPGGTARSGHGGIAAAAWFAAVGRDADRSWTAARPVLPASCSAAGNCGAAHRTPCRDRPALLHQDSLRLPDMLRVSMARRRLRSLLVRAITAEVCAAIIHDATAGCRAARLPTGRFLDPAGGLDRPARGLVQQCQVAPW